MHQAILTCLAREGYLTNEQLAARLGLTPQAVGEALAELEARGILLGYQPMINWEKTEEAPCTALIEVRVTPQRGQGFDRIAQRLYQHPEVDSCYLMSGSFDLMVILRDKSLRDVARFVSDQIAPLEAVQSTATHFILKTYKNNGLLFSKPLPEDREAVVL